MRETRRHIPGRPECETMLTYMQLMYRSVLLVGLAFCPALVPAYASASGAPLNIPMSVRQMGRGDVTFMEGDIMRAWSNPALLADQATAWELEMNGTSMFDSQQNTFGLGAGWLVSPGLAVGLLGNSFSAGFPEVNDYGDETGDSLVWNQRTGGVVAAMRMWILALGGTAKYIADDIVGERAGKIAYDGGLVAEYRGARAGVSVRNMGGSLRVATANVPAEELPMEVRAALGYALPFWRLSAAGEYVVQKDSKGRGGVGIEWWPVGVFGIRAGSRDVSAPADQPTYGFTVKMRKTSLDYSLGTHVAGLTHMMSLSYSLGPTAGQLAEEHARQDKDNAERAVEAEKVRQAEEKAAQAEADASAKRLEEALARTQPESAAVTGSTETSTTAMATGEGAPAQAAATPVPPAVGSSSAAEASPAPPTSQPAPADQGGRLKPGMVIGVIPFTGEGVSSSDAYMISAMFRNELVKLGTLKVVESENMDKVLAAQSLQMTGCTSSDCAVKVGKILNVQGIVMGSYGIVMQRSVVNIRVVNVETGVIMHSDNINAQTYEDLDKGLREMAGRLTKAGP